MTEAILLGALTFAGMAITAICGFVLGYLAAESRAIREPRPSPVPRR